jgi:hypothetical protein
MKIIENGQDYRWVDGEFKLITVRKIFIHPTDHHCLATAAKEKLETTIPGDSLVLHEDNSTDPPIMYIADQGLWES